MYIYESSILLPLFYMFYLVIFLCMFTNNAPPNQVHSFVSDPGGGGVLHLVSELRVKNLAQEYNTLSSSLEIELCSSIRIYSTARDRHLFGEDPPWIQDPFMGRPLMNSTRRRTGYPLYHPLLDLDRVSLCVSRI